MNNRSLPLWLSLLLAPSAGALATLGFAPYHQWFSLLLSIAVFSYLLTGQSTKRAALLGWLYGIGLWGSGVSWLYVSIHDYGHTPTWLSLLMVGFVAMVMGLFTATQAAIYRYWHLDRRALLSFPALFVLFEWLRTWLFTGFPWLFAGYAVIDTPLAGYAPVLGVFGVSLMAVISAQCLTLLAQHRKQAWTVLPLLALIWGTGYGLQFKKWTKPIGQALPVSVVQGNIPQDVKWQLEWRDKTLDIYRQLSKTEWGQPVIIWPEAAIPMFQFEALDFLSEMDNNALTGHSALVTGIPFASLQEQDVNGYPVHFYNAIMGMGEASGVYFKQRLVPFGEYIPFEKVLRGSIPFFSRDMSSFSAGDSHQQPLQVQQYRLGAAICYEIAYPELTRRNAQKSDFLVTLSNDGWFGHSIGPHQHLQMVQMRALETGKWIIRATNNGISAFINPHGELVKIAPQFERLVLRGYVQTVKGSTPFAKTGSWPLLGLCLLLVGLTIRFPQKSS